MGTRRITEQKGFAKEEETSLGPTESGSGEGLPMHTPKRRQQGVLRRQPEQTGDLRQWWGLGQRGRQASSAGHSCDSAPAARYM